MHLGNEEAVVNAEENLAAYHPYSAGLRQIVSGGSDLGVHGQLDSHPVPFFMFSDNRPVTTEHFVVAVWEALLMAGYISAHYAGHSFRIKAAMMTAWQGIQDSLII